MADTEHGCGGNGGASVSFPLTGSDTVSDVVGDGDANDEELFGLQTATKKQQT